MTRARTRRAAEVRAEALVAHERIEQSRVVAVMHLARQVLEESIELFDVEIRDRQERRGVGVAGLRLADRLHVELQFVAKTLRPPGHPDQIAALELTGQE